MKRGMSHSDASHGQTQSDSTLYRRILKVSPLDVPRLSQEVRMYTVSEHSDRCGIPVAF